MNVYDAMWRIFDYAISYLDIVPDTAASNEDVETIAKLLDAYDELEPTMEQWEAYPWAQWMTIFDNGKLIWWELEPGIRIMQEGEYAWMEKDGRMGKTESGQVSPLPLGIDWRLCKWQRPEAIR